MDAEVQLPPKLDLHGLRCCEGFSNLSAHWQSLKCISWFHKTRRTQRTNISDISLLTGYAADSMCQGRMYQVGTLN